MVSSTHRKLAFASSLVTTCIGIVVLVGWILKIDALKTVLPGFVNMKANTALSFLCLGAAAGCLCWRDRLGAAGRIVPNALALIALTLGALTLIQYIFGVSLGIDELLFKDTVVTSGTSDPGRMAPNTAFNFTLLGLGVFLIQRGDRAIRFAQWLVVVTLFITTVALIGYLFEARVFVTVAKLTRMALHTMTAFIALGTALLFISSQHGFMFALFGASPGGFLARRMLLPALLIPLLLSLAVNAGRQRAYYDAGFALALVAVLSLVSLTALIWMIASQLNAAETRRLAVEAERAKAAVRAQSALEASRLKSDFLANMSHEIRTPMNGVIGMTGLLLDSSLTEAQRDYVETIRTSGDSLLAIINDILDFSKIEAGKMVMERAEFNLHECIEQAFDVLAFRAHQKGLELVYQIDTNVPTTVLGDALRLRQVLINLIGNAVKFTDRGEIVLTVGTGKRAGVECELNFVLTDTGIGMSREAQGLLFTSFQQVDSSPTRRHGGTGLGLVICKRLVELMGGAIAVESVEGRGSTFRFHVVLTPVDTHKVVPSFAHQLSPEQTRLLIVDDNATNLRILSLQLSGRGFVVTQAASAKEALTVLESRTPFAAVITDMQMPEMDGITLAQRIRATPATARLPLILLSSSMALRENVAPDLFVAQLLKPAKPGQLLAAITRAVAPTLTIKAEQTVNSPVVRQLSLRFPLTILVAEDNAVNQKVIRQLLLRMGFQPDVVSDGQEAVTATQRRKYDLVLMDIQMPVLDGVEAMRAIRARSTLAPQMVAVTANALSEDRNRFLAAGFDDYISKPIPARRLEELIERQGRLLITRDSIEAQAAGRT